MKNTTSVLTLLITFCFFPAAQAEIKIAGGYAELRQQFRLSRPLAAADLPTKVEVVCNEDVRGNYDPTYSFSTYISLSASSGSIIFSDRSTIYKPVQIGESCSKSGCIRRDPEGTFVIENIGPSYNGDGKYIPRPISPVDYLASPQPGYVYVAESYSRCSPIPAHFMITHALSRDLFRAAIPVLPTQLKAGTVWICDAESDSQAEMLELWYFSELGKMVYANVSGFLTWASDKAVLSTKNSVVWAYRYSESSRALMIEKTTIIDDGVVPKEFGIERPDTGFPSYRKCTNN